MTSDARVGLQAGLFWPLVILLFFSYLYVLEWVSWLPSLGRSRSLRLTTLWVHTALACLLVSAAFAYPLAWLYERMAGAVALVASLLVVAWYYYLADPAHMSMFGRTHFAFQNLALVVCLPFAVWLVARRRARHAQIL